MPHLSISSLPFLSQISVTKLKYVSKQVNKLARRILIKNIGTYSWICWHSSRFDIVLGKAIHKIELSGLKLI